MKKIKENIGIIFLTLSSFFTHFLFFGYPAETVFDEVHFGKFITGYFSGEYFFDIHPPLAKLLITGAGIIGGYRPTIGFGVIGEGFTDTSFIWLRLLPALAGALLPIVIYYLCRTLNFSKMASFAAAFLVIVENSLLVQSRFILLDSLLLLFGFGSLLFYFLYKKNVEKRSSLYLFTLSLLLASFTLSIKWTGVSFLALIVGLEFIACRRNKASFREYAAKAFFFLSIPFLIYLLSFGIHFALLQKTGPGKDFMTDRFQKTLIGNEHENDEIEPLGFFGKFVELNVEMLRANQRLDAIHPYGSLWYTWPLMKRPIYYWVGDEENTLIPTPRPPIEASPSPIASPDYFPFQNEKEGKIYLLGNPLLYWLGALSVIFLLLYVFLKQIDEKALDSKPTAYFLLSAYFLNFLPFIFIGRVMFLYHYFASLIFSLLILTFLLDRIRSKKTKRKFFILLILSSLLVFTYFLPLSYGLPLTREAQEARFLFTTWE